MNRSSSLFPAALGLAFAAMAGGCASQNQWAKLTAEKEQLVAAVESEKKLNSDLASRLQLASDRAGEAERELALASGGKPAPSANLVHMPVRPSNAAMSFEQWSRTQPLLRYDSRGRAARVDLDLSFDDSDRLSMDSRRELHQVADCLATGGAARYGVVVASIPGKSATEAQARKRADAVADWLNKRGLGSDRVTTTMRSGGSLVDEEGRKLNANRSVELEIVELPGRDAVATDPSKSGDGWISSGRR